jgi:DNA polymerase-3 subunit epsilon
MPASDLLKFFAKPWNVVPTVWIDTETTGIRAGIDRAVSVGLARFERGGFKASTVELVDPGIPIPAEATAIHGITDDMVRGRPTIGEVFRSANFLELLNGAQPAAYNAPFDRHFVPPFGSDWTWPWLDALSVVRVVDRYERGKGRHRLEAVAARHRVRLVHAHSADADARAAGYIFYKLIPMVQGHACDVQPSAMSLGQMLRWQRDEESNEWFRFNEWLQRQPPLEETPNK